MGGFVGTSEGFTVGCGDGNQLGLADYPQYLGLDVAPGAIKLCTDKFSDDNSKSFMLFDPFYFILWLS